MRQFSNVTELYHHWGFLENPFQKRQAETEAGLIDFFLAPSWIDQTTNEKAERAAFLVGPRGMGKTAIRLYVEGTTAKQRIVEKGPILVPYVHFDHIDGSDGSSDAHLKHLNQIVRLMLAFGLLHRHEVEAHTKLPQALDARFANLLHRYFGSRDDLEDVLYNNSDFVLSSSTRVLESYTCILEQAYPWYTCRPVRRFARTHWGTFSHLFGEAVRQVRGIKAQFLSPEGRKRRVRKVQRDFRLLAASAESFHGRSWWILVDRLDEHSDRMCEEGRVERADARSLAKRLTTSLMSDARLLLETEGVYFKFFLWSELRPSLRQFDIRVDRSLFWTVSWNARDLEQMLCQRLAHFSEERVKTLGQICSEADGARIQNAVTRLAHGSPRRLLDLLDAMVSEHLDYCRREHVDASLLTEVSCIPGLSECCSRIATTAYDEILVDRIRKLGQMFSLTEVTEQLGLDDPHRHLTEWREQGAILETGFGEGSGTEFKVTDPVLLWAIDRSLILK